MRTSCSRRRSEDVCASLCESRGDQIRVGMNVEPPVPDRSHRQAGHLAGSDAVVAQLPVDCQRLAVGGAPVAGAAENVGANPPGTQQGHTDRRPGQLAPQDLTSAGTPSTPARIPAAASPACADTSLAAASRRCPGRSASTTRMPSLASCCASANPMPLAAPVTTATRPSRSSMAAPLSAQSSPDRGSLSTLRPA